MLSMDEVIARINVLAKKAKTEGLTDEELVERDKLRRIYIDSVKANLTGSLENTYVVDEQGNKRKLTENKKSQTHRESRRLPGGFSFTLPALTSCLQ